MHWAGSGHTSPQTCRSVAGKSSGLPPSGMPRSRASHTVCAWALSSPTVRSRSGSPCASSSPRSRSAPVSL
eukprot:3306832-Pyramimonas_sp.AAC.1